MKSTVLNLIAFLACVSTPAWADDVKPIDAATPAELTAEGPKASAAAVTYESQHAAIMKECGVDPVNEKQLLTLLQSWDEVTKGIVASSSKSSPDLVEKLAMLDKEIQAARDSKNDDMAEHLSQKRASVADLMAGWDPGARKQLEEYDRKYSGAVREMVSPEKLDRLDEILDATQEAQPNRPRKGPVRSPRALKAIVDRLGDLTPEQRKNIDGAFLQFRDSRREHRGQSPENTLQEKKLYDDVFAVLTPGQKTRVEQQLAGRTATSPADPKTPATPGNAAPAIPTGLEESNKPASGATPPVKSADEKP